MNSSDWQQINAAFQKIWGYKNFRYPQAEVIKSILTGNDALVVMPTGGGKSICFQLPSLLQTGLTIVVSPLVALMENQVRELQQRHLPAALLHNESPRWQRQETKKAIATGNLRLLYLSPETLLSHPVWQQISQPQVRINALILDEAHCLVQWGSTFRPAYRRLGAVRSALLKCKPSGSKIAIAAFTATADPDTQKDIIQTLQLQQPKTFLISPYRNNLHLQVRTVWTPKGRKKETLKFIQSHNKQAGLVYVRSRRDSQELAEWLKSFNLLTTAYHAGLNVKQRREIEHDWLTDKIQFVVSTSAFGMGINKSDVRWVLHFHAPYLLSEYLQEIGRGGRDEKFSEALTLISEPTGWLNPEDKNRDRFFTQQLQQKYQQARQIAKQIPSQGNLDNFSKIFPDGEIALSILHNLGYIYWQDPFNYQKLSSSNFNLSFKEELGRTHMREYLQTRQCRWQFLLDAFGFKTEANSFRCHHCDNCQK
jgi:ATP-dependent DNA helicase RecQ